MVVRIHNKKADECEKKTTKRGGGRNEETNPERGQPKTETGGGMMHGGRYGTDIH